VAAGIPQGQKHLTDMGSQLCEQFDILHCGHFGFCQDDRAVQRGQLRIIGDATQLQRCGRDGDGLVSGKNKVHNTIPP
jgi:hypothetical protein